ncbi:hypothetical protein [Pseudoduganella violaceinigra]|uniref:hypothetical protein n=1 Tax=Pseudoduganella violaceinigra TaxID=246602 RepID=UPI0012B5975D|nr:hypothetical protein [Pseudoduganella violaceinigra]
MVRLSSTFDSDQAFAGYTATYGHTEIRPSATAAQRAAGRSSVADLARRIGANHYLRRDYAGGAGATVLGRSLLDGFVAGKPNQLTGHTITSPGDLATVVQD